MLAVGRVVSVEAQARQGRMPVYTTIEVDGKEGDHEQQSFLRVLEWFFCGSYQQARYAAPDFSNSDHLIQPPLM